ncbi:MAG TPA: enoyl-CoA hydratase/isomerase family protein [Jatrophihabitans sp.]|nr:enoyl-CoA hydratase/isomerase family protein [Jatrophihabitans sp.]
MLSSDGATATVTLNQPHIRNAQNPLTWAWLLRSVNDLPGTVRVLLLRGEGPSFSAGLDRRLLTAEGVHGATRPLELAAMSPEQASAEIAGYQQAFGALARPGLISIAAVQGHAVGAGFQLALACDLRVAAPDAQFSMAEVGLGLVPDLGGTKRLVELVGYSRAAELCLTGRRVGAEEALRIGLVNQLAPAGELIDAARAWADRILALPRTAVTEIKALLLAAADRGQDEQERAEREAQHRQLRHLAGLEGEH